ncbi:MAG: TonB-dependent receptor [Microscillaceae bacterium]|nr:TonB-dependent receptor [Microscillaceae bacterium]
MPNLNTKVYVALLFCFFFLFVFVKAQEKKKLRDIEKTKFDAIYTQPRIEIEVAYEEQQRVSTAGRGNAQDPALVPATVISISQELIESRAYQSLWDILQDLPGIKTDYQVLPESFNRVTFRGIVGMDKFLILLDGIRISSPTNEEIPILENYPIHMAKQIEILYGPASALYGADAFAGVINIISKTADDIDHAELSMRAGMYGKFVGNALLGHRFSDKVSFMLSGQYAYDQQPNLSKFYKDEFAGIDSLQSGNFKTEAGNFSPSSLVEPGYKIPISNYALQGTLQLEKLWGNDKLRFNFFQNQSRTPSVAGMNPNNAVYNENNFMSHRILMGNINYIKNFGRGLELNTIFTASRYSLDPESGFQNVYTQMERSYRFAVGRMFQFEQLVSWNPQNIEELSVVAGFTYQNFRSIPLSVDLLRPTRDFDAPSGIWFGTVVKTNDIRPQGIDAIFYDIVYSNLGGFIQAQYALPWVKDEGLILTLGGRVDRNSRFKAEFNPRLGLVWTPSGNKNTIIKFLYGKAFLEPSPLRTYEQFGTFSASVFGDEVTYSSRLIHQPNPNLQPQKAQTFEFSLQTQFKKFGISFQAFYSYVRNLIIPAPDGALSNLYDRNDLLLGENPADNFDTGIDLVEVNVNQNQGGSNVYGGDLLITYEPSLPGLNSFKAYMAWGYIAGNITSFYNPVVVQDGFKPSIDTVSTQLPYISPWTFRLGFDMRLHKFLLSPRFMYVNEQYLEAFIENEPSKRQKLSGYTRLDVSITYKIKESVNIFLKTENVLDNHYYHSTAFGTRVREDNGKILPDREFFRGSPQNPIRVSGGISIQL